MGLELAVSPGTLVPRVETELLATAAIEMLRAQTGTVRVVDLCCGAGNLACAVAYYVPTAQVWATDVSEAAAALTRRNAQRLGLAARVSAYVGDLLTPLSGLGLEEQVDMIVCNPPYISERRLEADRAHLLEHEPREAFAAGPYGMAVHMRAVKDALTWLKPRGALLLEVGVGQDRQVQLLFERAGRYDDVQTLVNEAGEARVVHAVRK
jgi:release factor glutamine methyltransferase